VSGRIGLIAGNGALPRLFARAARAKGLGVVAVGHVGETDPELASEVERLDWVKVGQVARIERLLRDQGVSEAVLAGGFSRMRAVQQMRPDLGLFRIAARLRSFRDDALLRAAADISPAHRSTPRRSGTSLWARRWRRSSAGPTSVRPWW